MKDELINLYNKNYRFTLLPMKRNEFYEGIVAGKYTDLFVEVINIFIFKSNGQIALQKRAVTKNHNPGLLDKSIGGHIICGHTPKLTVMGETIQELGTAAYVAENADEFGQMLEMLEDHTNTVSLALRIDTVDISPIKVINGKEYRVGNRSHVYFGIYDGPIDFKDSEAAGINYYSLEELSLEMKNNRSLFTDDMHFYLENYWDMMVHFRTRWLQR